MGRVHCWLFWMVLSDLISRYVLICQTLDQMCANVNKCDPNVYQQVNVNKNGVCPTIYWGLKGWTPFFEKGVTDYDDYQPLPPKLYILVNNYHVTKITTVLFVRDHTEITTGARWFRGGGDIQILPFVGRGTQILPILQGGPRFCQILIIIFFL